MVRTNDPKIFKHFCNGMQICLMGPNLKEGAYL